MKLSDEERKRRRELALKMREEGKLGGKKALEKAGRPRNKRANELVAESAREDGVLLVKTLRNLIKTGTETTKLKALITYLEIEAKEHDKQVKEEQKAYENMGRDKLLALIGDRFKELKSQGIDVEALMFGKADAINVEAKELESGDQ